MCTNSSNAVIGVQLAHLTRQDTSCHTDIPLSRKGEPRLTAKADFGDFVTAAARFPRENRGFRPRRLTQLAKSRPPRESCFCQITCDKN
jgi:hypothetical protein